MPEHLALAGHGPSLHDLAGISSLDLDAVSMPGVLAPDMCAISAAARLPPGTFASPPPVVPHASLSFVPRLHLPGRLQSTLTPPVCTSSGPCCAAVPSLPRWRCGCLRIDRVPGVLDKDIDRAALGGTRTRWVASSAHLACPSPCTTTRTRALLCTVPRSCGRSGGPRSRSSTCADHVRRSRARTPGRRPCCYKSSASACTSPTSCRCPPLGLY